MHFLEKQGDVVFAIWPWIFFYIFFFVFSSKTKVYFFLKNFIFSKNSQIDPQHPIFHLLNQTIHPNPSQTKLDKMWALQTKREPSVDMESKDCRKNCRRPLHLVRNPTTLLIVLTIISIEKRIEFYQKDSRKTSLMATLKPRIVVEWKSSILLVVASDPMLVEVCRYSF